MYLLGGKIDYPLNMLLIRIVLPCFILIEYCTGCGRSSSRSSNQPKSQGHTATNGQVEIPGNHRLKCTENETQTIVCRNGGTCFATYIDYRFVRCAKKRRENNKCRIGCWYYNHCITLNSYHNCINLQKEIQEREEGSYE